MSDNGKACPQCGAKPKSKLIQGGTYGGIITVALIACSVLHEFVNMP